MNYTKPIDTVLAKAQNVKQIKPNEWMVECPCHDDNKQSLHITEDQTNHKVLMRCHANCRNEDIMRAWGLQMRDLFPARTRDSRRIAAVYDYTDSAGVLKYQSVRYEPKDFRQRRPDGSGGWIWNLQGIECFPYQLPELKKALDDNKMVLVVEGEKDVDRLYKLGIPATCNHGGAGKWRQAHSQHFPPGSKITILPDNDEPGRKHAQDVAAQLTERECQVRILYLPDLPEKGDISDWLDAGHTKEELLALIVKTWETTKQLINNPLKPKLTCLEDIEAEEIHWLWDMFLASRKLTILEGDPGEGKTFLALALIAIITNGWPFPDEKGKPDRKRVSEPGNVIYMTAEDGLADTIKPRLEMLGADHKRVFVLEGYFKEDSPDDIQSVTLTDLSILRAAFEQIKPALLVVDPLQAYLGAGVDMHRANEVRPVLTGVMRLAEEFNTAVIFIRHLNKASGGKALYRGMGSIDFNAAARSVLLVGRDPDDKHKRVVIQTKSSLSGEAPAIGFTLDDKGFTWTGVSKLTADQVLSQSREDGENKTAVDEAKEFLDDILQDGPVSTNDIFSKAQDLGVSKASIRRAKNILNIRTYRQQGQGREAPWMWQISCSNNSDEHLEQVIKTPNYVRTGIDAQDAQVKNMSTYSTKKTCQEVNRNLWSDIAYEVDPVTLEVAHHS